MNILLDSSPMLVYVFVLVWSSPNPVMKFWVFSLLDAQLSSPLILSLSSLTTAYYCYLSGFEESHETQKMCHSSLRIILVQNKGLQEAKCCIGLQDNLIMQICIGVLPGVTFLETTVV